MAAHRQCLRVVAMLLLFAQLARPPEAHARSLAEVRERGILTLCAHPAAPPLSARVARKPGVQVEIAQRLAEHLGVPLAVEWIASARAIMPASCDLTLDEVLGQMPGDNGMRVSNPYHTTGVALAVRQRDTLLRTLPDLAPQRTIGVLIGSSANEVLIGLRYRVRQYHLEADLLRDLGARKIDAAAVSPEAIGYAIHSGARRGLKIIPVFEQESRLRWLVGAGLRRPDEELLAAINAALAALSEGELATIYARYGLRWRAP